AALYQDNYAHWYECRADAGARVLGGLPGFSAAGAGLGGPLAAAGACYPIDPYDGRLVQWRPGETNVPGEGDRPVHQELDDFTIGLRALANKPDDAARFVADVNAGKEVKIGERMKLLGGLAGRIHGTKGPESRWDLDRDQDLKDLREAFVRAQGKD